MIQHRSWFAILAVAGCCVSAAFAQSGASGTGGTTGGTSGQGTSGTSGSGTGTGSNQSGGTNNSGGTKSGSTPDFFSIFSSGVSSKKADGTTGGNAQDTPNGATGATTLPGAGTGQQPTETPAGLIPAFGTGGTGTGTGASSAFGPQTTGQIPGQIVIPGLLQNQQRGQFGSEQPATADGTGLTAKPIEQAPATFKLPGFFGQGAQTYTAGQGRLSKPRYRFEVNLATGFDDNILQLPDSPVDTPDIFQDVQDPGSPGVLVLRTVQTGTTSAFGNGGIIVTVPTFRNVIVREGAREPGTQRVLVQEGRPGEEKKGSFIARASGTFEMNFVNRRTLFLFNVGGSADYFFSRPNDPVDLSGSLGLSVSHRASSKLTYSGSLGAGYVTDPDFGQINAPNQSQRGDYINLNSRAGVNYRWTPRLSSSASLGYNSVIYQEERSKGGNYDQYVFSIESGYAFHPRLRLSGEYRHQMSIYESGDRDSTTDFFLIGSEFTLNSRLKGGLRGGLSALSFEQGGDLSIAPYMEGELSYRLAARDQLTLSTRFGFEEPNNPGTEETVFRLSLQYQHTFTPHLTGGMSLTYVQNGTTNRDSGEALDSTILDAGLNMQYQVSRRFSLYANYNFTDVQSFQETNTYKRNRIFLGGNYEF